MEETGSLEGAVEKLRELYSPRCRLCPRECGARREEGERGRCLADGRVFIAQAGLHFGEEPVISGYRGSGTVFFCGCNLRCRFCQNWEVSRFEAGVEVSVEELAGVFLELQKKGAHNLNLVTPTHYAYQIAESILLARRDGFSLPVVWNSSAYEKPEVISLVSSFVDIFLPDLKFVREEVSSRLTEVSDYWKWASRAVRRMIELKGELAVDRGLAVRGVIVRHHVLPGGLSDTEEVLSFLAELSPNTWLSLMNQYFPCGEAFEIPPLNRRLSREEYRRAVETARSLGFENGWFQSSEDEETNIDWW